jgi:hypothetical protein
MVLVKQACLTELPKMKYVSNPKDIIAIIKIAGTNKSRF